MIKLFITLNVLLIAVLVSYLLGVDSYGQYLVRPFQETYYQNIGKGTVHFVAPPRSDQHTPVYVVYTMHRCMSSVWKLLN